MGGTREPQTGTPPFGRYILLLCFLIFLFEMIPLGGRFLDRRFRDGFVPKYKSMRSTAAPAGHIVLDHNFKTIPVVATIFFFLSLLSSCQVLLPRHETTSVKS